MVSYITQMYVCDSGTHTFFLQKAWYFTTENFIVYVSFNMDLLPCNDSPVNTPKKCYIDQIIS